MKNNNGFTLVELLAVIAILGIILTISVISVSGTISRSTTKSHEILNNEIYEAAKKYVVDNINDFPDGTKDISISTLTNNGYLKDLDSKITVNKITINVNGNKYSYTIGTTYEGKSLEKTY